MSKSKPEGIEGETYPNGGAIEQAKATLGQRLAAMGPGGGAMEIEQWPEGGA